MNHRKKTGTVLLLILIILIGRGIYTSLSNDFIIRCIDIYGSYFRCADIILFGENPVPNLILFSILFSTIPLFFLKEEVYKTWRNFSLVFIPLMLIFIFTSPESSGGLFGTTSLFDRESAAMVSTPAYLILSYIIIAVKAWKTRGKVE